MNVPKPQPTVIITTEAPIVKISPPPVSIPKPSAPPMLMPGVTYVILEKPHIIDENNPQMKKYGIISVPQETIVQLVEGNLEYGLGGALHDYIIVSFNLFELIWFG